MTFITNNHVNDNNKYIRDNFENCVNNEPQQLLLTMTCNMSHVTERQLRNVTFFKACPKESRRSSPPTTPPPHASSPPRCLQCPMFIFRIRRSLSLLPGTIPYIVAVFSNSPRRLTMGKCRNFQLITVIMSQFSPMLSPRNT